MTDLRAYVQHKPDCPALPGNADRYTMNSVPVRACTCGLEAALAAPPPQPEKDFRRCGFCHVWATKPCGEQCCWSADSETVEQHKAALAAEPPDPHVARRQLPILKKLHAPAEVIEEAERLAAAPPPQQDTMKSLEAWVTTEFRASHEIKIPEDEFYWRGWRVALYNVRNKIHEVLGAAPPPQQDDLQHDPLCSLGQQAGDQTMPCDCDGVAAPPPAGCKFMEPQRTQPCWEVFPHDQTRWCGRCLIQRFVTAITPSPVEEK